jgi:replicative DNA helicase
MPQHDNVQPHNIEAEQALIAACFINPRIIPQVQQILSQDDFYRTAHQLIFQGIAELKDKLEPVVFGEWARTQGILDKIGGIEYLNGILDIVSSSVGWKYHAETIKGLSQRRELISVCSSTLERVFSPLEDFDAILSEHKNSLREVQAERKPSFQSPAQLVNDAYKLIEDRSRGKAQIAYPTGFSVIDEKIQGLEPSCTYYLGAPSHTGKSALALNIADHLADNGMVLYFILESTAVAQTFRRMANKTGIPLTRLRLGNLYGDPEWEELTKAASTLSESKLYVIDQGQYAQFERMQALCETMAMEHELRLVVVDFLQLISIRGSFQSEHHKYKAITIQFNHLAKALQCPFLILSQLNAENQLKESRDIYSNADHVWRLEREEDSKTLKIIGEKGKDTGKWKGWMDFDSFLMRFKDHQGEPPERTRKDTDL